MFDKLKSMGALAALMKNQDQVRAAGERVRARLEAARVEGEAGAGAARVVATGAMRVLSVELAPALVTGMAVDEKTRSLAASLIADAVNDAIAKAQACLRDEIGQEARELGLDGMLPELAALGLPGMGT